MLRIKNNTNARDPIKVAASAGMGKYIMTLILSS
jgi:hypothetical protein